MNGIPREIQAVNLVNFVNLLLLPIICNAREAKQTACRGGKLTKLTKLTPGIWHFSAEKQAKRGVRGEWAAKTGAILCKKRELIELLLTTWGARRSFAMQEGSKKRAQTGRMLTLLTCYFQS